MHDELRFSEIVRILGRGKNASRSLHREEAYFAMTEICANRETPAQLGAMLMLMRVNEETAEELAGMVHAARDALPDWQGRPFSVDWPAYAGKRRQPSWYVLAAWALAQGGYPVFMHGGGEHTAGRQYARQVCLALGIPVAGDWREAESLSRQSPMVYCPLSGFAPKLSHLIDMKAELGLRSPVNTLVRNLNPTGAPVTLQGMFHPTYKALHHETARLLGDTYNVVLKGDSGEFEMRPDSDSVALALSPNHPEEVEIPRVLAKRSIRPEAPSLDLLLETWGGDAEPEYGIAAIQDTMALVLMLADGTTLDEARQKARSIWSARSIS